MKKLEDFKQKLLQRKAELRKRLDAIDRDIKHEDMSSDWTEQATERENDEVLASLGVASKNELTKINDALKRIESGEYFTCSVCGKDIPPERLELLPFSTTCVNCAGKK
jgi:RNA polymerase-binding protein DksA